MEIGVVGERRDVPPSGQHLPFVDLPRLCPDCGAILDPGLLPTRLYVCACGKL